MNMADNKHCIIFHLDWVFQDLDGKKEHQVYRLKCGDRVPGVTTVLGVLQKHALLDWSARVERENVLAHIEAGLPATQLPDKFYYATIRDTAASVGSIAHFMAECWINKKNPRFIDYEPELIQKAEGSFSKFQKWWEESGFKMVESETQIVSEYHRFGGTLDIVAQDQSGSNTLIDLKTSKGIYGDYLSQIAAYKELWNENKPNKIKRQMIVRIGKEDPEDLEIKEYSNALIDEHFCRFLGALKVYEQDRKLRTWRE